MKIYDVTLPIHNTMLVWKGDPKPSIEQKTTIEKHGVALSMLTFSSHTGTHVDAPNHFVKGGKGIDSIPLEKLIGSCYVLDLTKIDHQEITVKDVVEALSRIRHSGKSEGRIQNLTTGRSWTSQDDKRLKGAKLLFKTGNYTLLKKSTFPKSYISLSLEGAKFLVQENIDLVGTDFLGIEKSKNPGHPVHTTLLKAGIVNVEGLDLEKVPAGKYQLYCLPLNIVGVDGAPARVILTSMSS